MKLTQRCEAINATTRRRCTAPAKFTNKGRPVCGRHRRPWLNFAKVEPAVVDAKAETMKAGDCADVLRVMAHSRASAAATIEQAVRETDWLWRRRFGDRGVRR